MSHLVAKNRDHHSTFQKLIMLIGSDGTHHQGFEVFLEDFLIPIVESNTILGIEVDNKLTFSHHIDQILFGT